MPTATRASQSTNISSIQFTEQGSAPATPASGYARLYFANDGLKWVDDTGAVSPSLEVQALIVKKASGNVSATVNGVAATYRSFEYQTAGVTRWALHTNNAAEAGANAGSNWQINRHADDDSFLGIPLTIFRSNGNALFEAEVEIDGDLDHDGSNVGFYGTAPTSKQTVTGSRGGNAALASLCTALAAIGLITDSTS